MMQYNITFNSNVLHINIEGILDFMDSRAFARLMRFLDDDDVHQSTHIQLNISKLMGLDATGKDLLMQIHDYAKKSGKHLTFCEAQGPILVFLRDASEYNNLHITECA